MIFSVEKMYRLPDAGSLKAFADVKIDDKIIIRGVRLLHGTKGLFVSMPQEQGKDGKWYDQVVCKDAATYELISEVVIRTYLQQSGVRVREDEDLPDTSTLPSSTGVPIAPSTMWTNVQ